MQLPAAYALVPPVVEGEHHGVAHDPLQRGQVLGVAGDPDHAHAVVDRRDGRLGAVDLRHDRQLFRAPAGALEVVTCLPGEVAAASIRILMSASMKPTFWCSITGTVPSLFSLRAKSSAYSKAARMVAQGEIDGHGGHPLPIRVDRESGVEGK